MNYSKSCADLMTALCAARLAFPSIPRNQTGFSKRSGQRYQYADISAIIDVTAPVLAQHGLVLLQSLEDGEGGTLRVVTTLIHASSEQWLSSELTVEKPANMQDFGAVSTYSKRYAMQSLLNVSGEEDTDAAEVGEPIASKASTPEPSPNGHTPPASESLEHPTKMLRGGWRLQAPGEWSRPTGGGSGLSLDRQPIGCRS
jgi:hypothetical protein